MKMKMKKKTKTGSDEDTKSRPIRPSRGVEAAAATRSAEPGIETAGCGLACVRVLRLVRPHFCARSDWPVTAPFWHSWLCLLLLLCVLCIHPVCPLGLCSLFGTELRDRECVAGELLQQGNQAGNMCMYKEYVGMGRECMDGVRSSCIRIIMY